MPDLSSAADEYAILQEITAPLATLGDDPVAIAVDVDFPVVLRGYDRLAVDDYVKRTSQLVAELQAMRSPEAAVRRAIERMGEQISGILQRAHDTAEQITVQSRAEAEDRLEVARQEAAQIAAAGQQRLKDLDADTDRIWAERLRIVEDARELAGRLIVLAESAAERFPPAEPEVRAEPKRRSATWEQNRVRWRSCGRQQKTMPDHDATVGPTRDAPSSPPKKEPPCAALRGISLIPRACSRAHGSCTART